MLYFVIDKIHQKNKCIIYISIFVVDVWFFIVLNFFSFNTKLTELFLQWKFSNKEIELFRN